MLSNETKTESVPGGEKPLIVPVRMSLEKAGEVRKIMDAHPGMSEGAARKILAGLEAEASKGGALLTGEEAMEPFLPSDLKAEALDPWAREEMSPAASEELRKFWDSDTCRNLKEMEGSPIPWLVAYANSWLKEKPGGVLLTTAGVENARIPAETKSWPEVARLFFPFPTGATKGDGEALERLGEFRDRMGRLLHPNVFRELPTAFRAGLLYGMHRLMETERGWGGPSENNRRSWTNTLGLMEAAWDAAEVDGRGMEAFMDVWESLPVRDDEEGLRRTEFVRGLYRRIAAGVRPYRAYIGRAIEEAKAGNDLSDPAFRREVMGNWRLDLLVRDRLDGYERNGKPMTLGFEFEHSRSMNVEKMNRLLEEIPEAEGWKAYIQGSWVEVNTPVLINSPENWESLFRVYLHLKRNGMRIRTMHIHDGREGPFPVTKGEKSGDALLRAAAGWEGVLTRYKPKSVVLLPESGSAIAGFETTQQDHMNVVNFSPKYPTVEYKGFRPPITFADLQLSAEQSMALMRMASRGEPSEADVTPPLTWGQDLTDEAGRRAVFLAADRLYGADAGPEGAAVFLRKAFGHVTTENDKALAEVRAVEVEMSRRRREGRIDFEDLTGRLEYVLVDPRTATEARTGAIRVLRWNVINGAIPDSLAVAVVNTLANAARHPETPADTRVDAVSLMTNQNLREFARKTVENVAVPALLLAGRDPAASQETGSKAVQVLWNVGQNFNSMLDPVVGAMGELARDPQTPSSARVSAVQMLWDMAKNASSDELRTKSVEALRKEGVPALADVLTRPETPQKNRMEAARILTDVVTYGNGPARVVLEDFGPLKLAALGALAEALKSPDLPLDSRAGTVKLIISLLSYGADPYLPSLSDQGPLKKALVTALAEAAKRPDVLRAAGLDLSSVVEKVAREGSADEAAAVVAGLAETAKSPTETPESRLEAVRALWIITEYPPLKETAIKALLEAGISALVDVLEDRGASPQTKVDAVRLMWEIADRSDAGTLKGAAAGALEETGIAALEKTAKDRSTPPRTMVDAAHWMRIIAANATGPLEEAAAKALEDTGIPALGAAAQNPSIPENVAGEALTNLMGIIYSAASPRMKLAALAGIAVAANNRVASLAMRREAVWTLRDVEDRLEPGPLKEAAAKSLEEQGIPALADMARDPIGLDAFMDLLNIAANRAPSDPAGRTALEAMEGAMTDPVVAPSRRLQMVEESWLRAEKVTSETARGGVMKMLEVAGIPAMAAVAKQSDAPHQNRLAAVDKLSFFFQQSSDDPLKQAALRALMSVARDPATPEVAARAALVDLCRIVIGDSTAAPARDAAMAVIVEMAKDPSVRSHTREMAAEMSLDIGRGDESKGLPSDKALLETGISVLRDIVLDPNASSEGGIRAINKLAAFVGERRAPDWARGDALSAMAAVAKNPDAPRENRVKSAKLLLGLTDFLGTDDPARKYLAEAFNQVGMPFMKEVVKGGFVKLVVWNFVEAANGLPPSPPGAVINALKGQRLYRDGFRPVFLLVTADEAVLRAAAGALRHLGVTEAELMDPHRWPGIVRKTFHLDLWRALSSVLSGRGLERRSAIEMAEGEKVLNKVRERLAGVDFPGVRKIELHQLDFGPDEAAKRGVKPVLRPDKSDHFSGPIPADFFVAHRLHTPGMLPLRASKSTRTRSLINSPIYPVATLDASVLMGFDLRPDGTLRVFVHPDVWAEAKDPAAFLLDATLHEVLEPFFGHDQVSEWGFGVNENISWAEAEARIEESRGKLAARKALAEFLMGGTLKPLKLEARPEFGSGEVMFRVERGDAEGAVKAAFMNPESVMDKDSFRGVLLGVLAGRRVVVPSDGVLFVDVDSLAAWDGAEQAALAGILSRAAGMDSLRIVLTGGEKADIDAAFAFAPGLRFLDRRRLRTRIGEEVLRPKGRVDVLGNLALEHWSESSVQPVARDKDLLYLPEDKRIVFPLFLKDLAKTVGDELRKIALAATNA